MKNKLFHFGFCIVFLFVFNLYGFEISCSPSQDSVSADPKLKHTDSHTPLHSHAPRHNSDHPHSDTHHSEEGSSQNCCSSNDLILSFSKLVRRAISKKDVRDTAFLFYEMKPLSGEDSRYQISLLPDILPPRFYLSAYSSHAPPGISSYIF